MVITYSRPSALNPPSPLKNPEITAVAGLVARRLVSSAVAAARFEARHIQMRRPAFGEPAPVDLLGKRAAFVADDDAGDRLQQDAVLVRYLLRAPHEDAARPIHHVCFDAGGDQPHDLFLQELAIAGAIFVPDHQVHTASPLRRQ